MKYEESTKERLRKLELPFVPEFKINGWWNRLDSKKKLSIYHTFSEKKK